MKKQLFSISKKVLCSICIVLTSHFATAQTGYFGTYFIDTATAGNTTGNYTTISNASLNGSPSAIFLETHNWTNGGAIYNPSTTGVWYTGTNWSIYNDASYESISATEAFNVVVPTTNGAAFQFTNITASGNQVSQAVNNAAANGNPGALLFITHNWGTAGGSSALYDTSVVGVWYDGGSWYLYNEKTYTAMPAGISFNVFVADTTGGAAFQLTTSASNTSGDGATISSPLTDNNPDAVLIVTHSFNGGLYDTVPVGVWYDGSNWLIYHEDRSAMVVGQTYNVLVASAPVNTGITNVSAGDMKFKVYPNPASDNISIGYTISESSDISITLYSTDGREVGTVYQGRKASGSYTLQNDVSALQPGSYYMVLSTGSSRATYPMVIVR